MKYLYIVHRLVLTILKQQDLHPGHRRYYRPRAKEEEQLSRRIQFTVKTHDSDSCRPKLTVKSPERQSYICRYKFYPAQQHPQAFWLHIYCACFVSMKVREQDIVLIYHACFIVHQGLRARYNYYTLIPLVSSHYRFKERGMIHIHSSCFVSWWFWFYYGSCLMGQNCLRATITR